jgi:hypothetical protein
MEPFRALTLLAAAGVVSLVGAGSAGFYAGYSAGRSAVAMRLDNVAAPGGEARAVSLAPVLEQIGALSKQVEALNVKQPAAAEDAGQSAKPVLDEIKALGRQIADLKAQPAAATAEAAPAAAPASDDGDLNDIRDQIKALNAKFDKQEPKAPKALVDEIHSLTASVQALEPTTRHAVSDEVRSAVSALQGSAEPRGTKAVLDELRSISAALKAQEPRSQPQPSVIDQIKVLNATMESLKARVPEDLEGGLRQVSEQVKSLSERQGAPAVAADGRGNADPELRAEITQLQQLVAAASSQFGKCQTQLASLPAASIAPPQPAAAPLNPITVSQGTHQEPTAVVFYDNTVLRKDQEKQYDEIGVRLSLQSVGPRQVKLAVNRQGVGLSFGERKVFRSQDVECELNLMETDLSDAQARVSISCKR